MCRQLGDSPDSEYKNMWAVSWTSEKNIKFSVSYVGKRWNIVCERSGICKEVWNVEFWNKKLSNLPLAASHFKLMKGDCQRIRQLHCLTYDELQRRSTKLNKPLSPVPKNTVFVSKYETLRNRNINENILKRTTITMIAQRIANLTCHWKGAHYLQSR